MAENTIDDWSRTRVIPATDGWFVVTLCGCLIEARNLVWEDFVLEPIVAWTVGPEFGCVPVTLDWVGYGLDDWSVVLSPDGMFTSPHEWKIDSRSVLIEIMESRLKKAAAKESERP